MEIQRFLETPVVDLVKEREETVIVIDGHRITGIIEYNGKRDRFYAISPERTPDSRIYTLITTALAYYRSKNPKILLTKPETLGY